MPLAVAMPLAALVALALGLGLAASESLVWAPAVWKEKRGRRVAWIGADPPADDEARVVWEAIEQRRLSTYGAVTRHVADRLFHTDLDRMGPASDIGFFRSWYLLHACHALERLDGRLVRIEGS